MEHNTLDIEPIGSTTKVDQVEKRLREYFKKKAYNVGDVLPKEQELTIALNVSRNVVREALSRLRVLGLIKTKKKTGMILAQPDIWVGLEHIMDPKILNHQTLKDLFELRLVIEIGLADLIFFKKTEKDIAELEEIVAKDTDEQLSFKLKYEVEFHGKLYSMTGNDTIIRFQRMLLPIFEYVVDLEKKAYNSRRVSNIMHRELLEILKNGTPEQFRNAMREHLKYHFDKIENHYESMT
jgi:GntR family transcriptional regulator, transcriptional repressor for pyruvate dehydrogenase complex